MLITVDMCDAMHIPVLKQERVVYINSWATYSNFTKHSPSSWSFQLMHILLVLIRTDTTKVLTSWKRLTVSDFW